MTPFVIVREISAALAGDELANRRRGVGRLFAAVAMTTGGVAVVGALGYGLAWEGRRLTGVARSGVTRRVSSARAGDIRASVVPASLPTWRTRGGRQHHSPWRWR